MTWIPGKGPLGPLDPLLGEWIAQADSPMGPTECRRLFAPILGGRWIELNAFWLTGEALYSERALYGPDHDGTLAFWSFTSDGKRSQGRQCDGTAFHPLALAFEVQLVHGVARFAWWPRDGGDAAFVAEARTATGWQRLVEHHCRRC